MKNRQEKKWRHILRREHVVAMLSALAVILTVTVLHALLYQDTSEKKIKAGFVYVDDASTAYIYNFMRACNAISEQYGDQVEIIEKFNVPEGDEKTVLHELADSGCDLIFTTSYGYGAGAKECAAMYPDIQFCQATCMNANEGVVLENYHNFMGEIYQGRYLSGVVAGLKLQELIEQGRLTAEEAKIGYVGAYPYAEVISGYTAFFLGIRSVVPQAVMTVKYTNSWSDYMLEKKYAKELIDEGCVIISQHSDTIGPAVACEQTDSSQIVYHVGYNQSMLEVAPTTYLTGCRIDWEPYMLAAVQAVLTNRKIEDCVTGHVHGQDVSAGFDKGWVEMLELNKTVVPNGTQDKIDEMIAAFQKGELDVFRGDYLGVNPWDDTDICDLNHGYKENENSSAPTFSYVLKDVITIEE